MFFGCLALWRAWLWCFYISYIFFFLVLQPSTPTFYAMGRMVYIIFCISKFFYYFIQFLNNIWHLSVNFYACSVGNAMTFMFADRQQSGFACNFIGNLKSGLFQLLAISRDSLESKFFWVNLKIKSYIVETIIKYNALVMKLQILS